MRIPLALRGESAAFRHFEKVCGAKASPNGRTEYWYAVPSKANLRKRLWCSVIWMWKSRSLNPLTQTSPRGEFAPGSVSALSFWTDVCKALCWWAWDLESGRVPRPFWVPQNSGCRNRSPARLAGLALLLLSWADSILLVSEPGHYEARLETAPHHWNGMVCIWIEEYILALSRLSCQREIPGITSHALMNWHSGLVVGCAAITCVGGSCALLWGGASGAIFIEWGGKSSLCENVCIFIEWTPNTQTFEHMNFWRLGAGPLSHSPPLFRPILSGPGDLAPGEEQ